MGVRVRFAPSPTGPLHMGGVRTALFNYLFAKKHQGTFIVRIEDTDQNRYVEGAEQYIKDALAWCGLHPDESPEKGGPYSPYRQSERKEIYQTHVQDLIQKGHAYYAFDTPEELDALRKKAETKGEIFTYNYANRTHLKTSLNMSAKEVEEHLNQNVPHVIRFKIPAGESLQMHDLIRGKVVVDTSTLDDKVLMKNDGLPTYHLANIVDDHLMQISHVIRGEEWLPSLPLHALMYKAFGWDAPQFAHLPLILKPEGKGKLSKRDGDKHGFPVFPLAWETADGLVKGYKEAGYLPEAFINMLAFLGWNPGTEQELFSLEELTQSFSLDKVSKSGARFNPEKAVWFNHQYLQKEDQHELTKNFQAILEEKGIPTADKFDSKVVELLKERANFVSDLWDQGHFFYQAPTVFDPKGFKKVWKNDTSEILNKFLTLDISSYEAEAIHHNIKNFVTDNNIGFGKIMMPLRLAMVGALHGPDIPLLMAMLGSKETIQRIKYFIKFGESQASS